MLWGIRLFDKEGNKILVAGRIEERSYANLAVKEFLLSEGERWLGIKSSSREGKKYGFQFDI